MSGRCAAAVVCIVLGAPFVAPVPSWAAGRDAARIFVVAGGRWCDPESGFAPSHARSGDGAPATSAFVCRIGDVAVLRDGSFILSEDALRPRIRRVDSAGTISTVAPVAGPVAALDDGGFLVAEVNNDKWGWGILRRVWPDGAATVLAGGGEPLSSDLPNGDGGPAVGAIVTSPRDVALRADGGILLSEGTSDFYTGNRVREVRPDGTITTFAGTGAGGSGGDGGPAAEATFSAPGALAVMSDGSVLIGDGRRLRKVAPDGSITSLFRGMMPTALMALPDGGYLVAKQREATRRTAGGGSEPVVRNRIERVGPDGVTSSVAGASNWHTPSRCRSVDGVAAAKADLPQVLGLAQSPHGALLMATRDCVLSLQRPGTGFLALATRPRAARASSTAYSSPLVVSDAARVTADVLIGSRLVAQAQLSARSTGAQRMTISGHYRPALYDVVVTARDARGRNAVRSNAVVLGGALPTQLALRVLGAKGASLSRPALVSRAGEAPDGYYGPAGCHRISDKRIDCEIRYTPAGSTGRASCASVVALRLGNDGQLAWNRYACSKGTGVFKARPRFGRPWTDVDLEALLWGEKPPRIWDSWGGVL